MDCSGTVAVSAARGGGGAGLHCLSTGSPVLADSIQIAIELISAPRSNLAWNVFYFTGTDEVECVLLSVVVDRLDNVWSAHPSRDILVTCAMPTMLEHVSGTITASSLFRVYLSFN